MGCVPFESEFIISRPEYIVRIYIYIAICRMGDLETGVDLRFLPSLLTGF